MGGAGEEGAEPHGRSNEGKAVGGWCQRVEAPGDS